MKLVKLLETENANKSEITKDAENIEIEKNI